MRSSLGWLHRWSVGSLVAIVMLLGPSTGATARAASDRPDLASVAGTAVPATFRVCASVAWNAPSVARQRRYLGRNPRWSTADRADPLPALRFPFVVRIRSASISYDQGHLNGLWTLSRRASARTARCPVPGGPRRSYVVIVKGWRVTRAELSSGGDTVAYGVPSAGRLQVLDFPGYGNTRGFANRGFSLERTDEPGCAIGLIEVSGAMYTNLLASGLSCGELRVVQRALSESADWSEPTDGFSCVTGLSGYGGQRVDCADEGGRTVHFGYSELAS